MEKHRDDTWSAALVTASSFLGLVIAVLFGGVAAFLGGPLDSDYLALGGICGATFVVHLRLA